MDVAQLAEVLTQASPWAVLAITTIVIVRMTFQYLENRGKTDELGAIKAAAEGAEKHSDAARASAEESKAMLTSALAVSDVAQRDMLGLLRKMTQELINLNANQPGSKISTENSKVIIETQWAWCRDESARLLINSIRNNHFKGSEGLVARKVRRAWQIAAKNAKQSVSRFSGLSYPYEELFDEHIQSVWRHAWIWAVPLYHRDAVDMESSLADLHDRVRSLFDSLLIAFFRNVEDIDKGILYAPPGDVTADGAYRNTNSEPNLHSATEPNLVDDMIALLTDYKVGTGSGPHTTIDMNSEVERRLNATDKPTRYKS